MISGPRYSWHEVQYMDMMVSVSMGPGVSCQGGQARVDIKWDCHSVACFTWQRWVSVFAKISFDFRIGELLFVRLAYGVQASIPFGWFMKHLLATQPLVRMLPRAAQWRRAAKVLVHVKRHNVRLTLPPIPDAEFVVGPPAARFAAFASFEFTVSNVTLCDDV